MRKNVLCSVLSALLLLSFPMAWAAGETSAGSGSASSGMGSGSASSGMGNGSVSGSMGSGSASGGMGSGSASGGMGSGSAGMSLPSTPSTPSTPSIAVPQTAIQANIPSAAAPESSSATEGRADAVTNSRGKEAKTQDAREKETNKQDAPEKEAKKQDAPEKDAKKQDEPDKQDQAAEKDDSVFQSEFQNFVAQSIGHTLPMYGYSLFHRAPSTFAPVDNIPVTPDYTIGPGDELIVHVWGQVEANQSVVVDRNGLINLPKIGSISVAGVRYQKLTEHIRDAIGRMFSNFEIDVSMGKLRSIRVFVVGQAARPGSFTVSSLSTLVNTLFVSGGPSAKGSMRHIQLKRGNKLISDFDLYDLLLKGDKSKDVQLLPGDVIYIPPIGPMAAISGSVNTQAIFELKGNENLSDLLDLASGLTNVAAGQKVSVERIHEHEMRKVDEFLLDKDGLAKPMRDGDVVTVFSISPRFDNAVKLQGNVAAPMRYIWKEGMRITDLLKDKNSVIPGAYWAKQNSGAINNRYNKKEVNWDYAVVQRLDEEKLTTKLVAFDLGKAIKGDPAENMLLQPGDVVTIFSVDDALPKAENDVVFRGSIFSPSDRRFVWHEGMRINDLIPSGEWLTGYYDYWSNLRGNKLSSGTNHKKEINWDYAVVQSLDEEKLVTGRVAFNLGKAIKGDSVENRLLRPGDAVTIFSAEEALPKTENDVVFRGSIFSPSDRRFVWREGMRVNDLIPSGKWLTDYYDYWSNSRGNNLSSGTDHKKEINWDYAVVQSLDEEKLVTGRVAFNLGKAIKGDSVENRLLRPGDAVTIFSAEEALPKTENDVVFRGSIFSPSDRRFVWREGMRINDLIPSREWLTDYYDYWSNSRENKLSSGTYYKKEINWDYAVVQRLDEEKLITRRVAFDLGKAVKGDPAERMPLQPGDVVTIFSAEEVLPKTENDIVLKGSIFSPSNRRFVWRQGMRINDLIPNAKWLTDYYDYWANLQGSKLSSGINWGYANVVRLQPRDLTRIMLTFDLGKAVLENDSANNIALLPGDEVSIFTNSEIQVSGEKEVKYITLEGEVITPGIYPVERGETLRQLVARLGGVTPRAYLRGGVFTRETVRQFQQKSLDEAIRKMSLELRAAEQETSSSATLRPEDAVIVKEKITKQHAMLESFRDIKATGRIVLEMPDEKTQVKDLPDLVLEEGDRFTVPSRPSTVSVVGAVYNQSTFMHKPGRAFDDYLEMAGGPTRDGDEENAYLVLADGTVKTGRSTSFFRGGSFGGGLSGRELKPGDLIFIPQKIDFEYFSLTGAIKDWTQIFYQFALGAAGGKAAKMW